MVYPEWFGAVGDSTTDDTTAFNAAIQFAATRKFIFVTGGNTYLLKGTIAPGGKFTWMAKDTTLLFDSTVTGYTSVAEVTGSGTRYVAFDTKGCGDSCISGRVILTTTKVPSDISTIKVNTQYRATLNTNLVACTASADDNNGQISWEHLLIMGFGYGLYQGDQTGLSPKLYPYTRWSITLLEIKFCLISFQIGSLTADKNYIGSGFDDASINVLRCTRCANVSGSSKSAYIAGTDLHIISVFYDGLAHDNDYEVTSGGAAITLKYDNSTNKATLSALAPNAAVGDVIAFSGGDNNNSNAIYYVSVIKSITTTGGGTQSVFTLDDPAGANSIPSTSQVNYFINPPGVKLINSKLTCQHYFTEEINDKPIELFDNAAFVSSDFKVSGGVHGCRTCYPILGTGLSYSVDVNVHPTTFNNANIKGVVGLGKVKSPATPVVYASGSCKITSANFFSDWIKCYLFSCIKLPGYLTSAFAPSQYYVDNYGTGIVNSINACADCADGKYSFSAVDGSVAFKQQYVKKTNISISTTPAPILSSGIEIQAPSVLLVTVKRSTTLSAVVYGTALLITNDSGYEILYPIVTASGGPTGTFSLTGTNSGDLQFKTSGITVICDVEYIRIG